jgi:hypothetical protein
MIARAKNCHTKKAPSWHDGFLAMLPAIRHQAKFALRSLPAQTREEAFAEVLAHAVVAYERLHQQGRAELAYPTPLVRFGVAQYHAGRRVGNRMSGRDVLSEYARRKHKFVVERLDQYSDHAGTWREILIEDRSVTPAELACVRLDVTRWLQTLAPRDRRLAETLAMGESTGKAAKKFRISPGRISQMRRQLCMDWKAFQGEPLDGVTAAA